MPKERKRLAEVYFLAIKSNHGNMKLVAARGVERIRKKNRNVLYLHYAIISSRREGDKKKHIC